MSKVLGKFIDDNAVDGTKLKLDNEQPLKGRNFADDGDVNALKVNANDEVDINGQVAIGLSNLMPATWSADMPGIVLDGTTAAATAAFSQSIIYKGNEVQGGLLVGTQDLTAGDIGTANVYLYTGAQLNGTLPSSGSGYMAFETGYSAKGSTGEFIFRTGQSDEQGSGKVDIVTGNAPTAGKVSGEIRLISGQSTLGTSGNIELRTGTGATRGKIVLKDGTETGAGAGAVWTQAAANGIGGWAAPSGGGAVIATSNQTGFTPSDPVAVSTGTTEDAASGLISLITGDSLNEGSGAISLLTGVSTAGSLKDTGSISINTGEDTGGNNNSGTIHLKSGNTFSGTSGNVDFTTGDSANNGISGGMNFTTGVAGTGTSGDIALIIGSGATQGKIVFVDSTEGTAGHVWTSIDINGKGGWAAPAIATFSKESLTLSAGDITNQYVDLAAEAATNSLDLVIGGVVMTEGSDYTLSVEAGPVTRITFAGDLATGGSSELVATDVLQVKYMNA